MLVGIAQGLLVFGAEGGATVCTGAGGCGIGTGGHAGGFCVDATGEETGAGGTTDAGISVLGGAPPKP